MPDLKGSSAAVPLILLQPLREGVEHFSELVTPDPPCHFCRENISRPVHEDCTRLKIVSRGKKLRSRWIEGDLLLHGLGLVNHPSSNMELQSSFTTLAKFE